MTIELNYNRNPLSYGKGFLCVIKYILLKKSYNVCMKTSRKIYAMNLFSNLIFYAPVALLVRTNRGISLSRFFVLQAILSVTCMVCEFPLGVLTDKIGLKKVNSSRPVYDANCQDNFTDIQ